MGSAVWYFLRPQPGELRPLASKKVDAFMLHGGRLAADADGFVRFAEVIVSLHERRPVEVLRVRFFQHRVHENGTLERAHFREMCGLASESVFGGLDLLPAPQGIVRAEHKFAKRRLEHISQWKPTQAELGILRDLVNRKARGQIM